MTIVEKQAWLWRYRKARPRMDQLEGKLKRMAGMIRELEAMECQPCHPDQRRRLEAEKKKSRQELESWKKALEELELDRQEIAAAIEKLEDSRYRQLMEYHYLEGWPWAQVACRMEYSPRYIYKLHKQALESIECKGRKRSYHLRAPECRIHCFPQRGVAL